MLFLCNSYLNLINAFPSFTTSLHLWAFFFLFGNDKQAWKKWYYNALICEYICCLKTVMLLGGLLFIALRNITVQRSKWEVYPYYWAAKSKVIIQPLTQMVNRLIATIRDKKISLLCKFFLQKIWGSSSVQAGNDQWDQCGRKILTC